MLGEHFFTAGKAERANLLATTNYQDEGVACYLPGGPPSGLTPLFRLNGTSHFYTTDVGSAYKT